MFKFGDIRLCVDYSVYVFGAIWSTGRMVADLYPLKYIQVYIYYLISRMEIAPILIYSRVFRGDESRGRGEGAGKNGLMCNVCAR